MHCAVCGDKNHIPIFKKYDFTLVQCLRCGLVQVENLSATFDIKHYDYYRTRMQLSDEELYEPVTAARYVQLLIRFERYRKNNTLLDIGCGEGHFLSVAKKMGWHARGIEKAPYAIEICKRFNIDVRCPDLIEADFPGNSYDIVTMSEVLEHLTQPREYLCKVNDILRTGGVLRITTPNFNCIARFLLQDKWSLIHAEHLFYFTPKTIAAIIKRCNFKLLELRTTLITLPELNRLFMDKTCDIYGINQGIRMTIEKNKFLSYLKHRVNNILNLTRLGESIECVCQKI